MTPRFWPRQRKDGAVISYGWNRIPYCHVEFVHVGPPSAVGRVGLSSKVGRLTGLDAAMTRWMAWASGYSSWGDGGPRFFLPRAHSRTASGGLASGQGLLSSVPKPVFALAQDL